MKKYKIVEYRDGNNNTHFRPMEKVLFFWTQMSEFNGSSLAYYKAEFDTLEEADRWLRSEAEQYRGSKRKFISQRIIKL